jgi:hypothetical protein
LQERAHPLLLSSLAISNFARWELGSLGSEYLEEVLQRWVHSVGIAASSTFDWNLAHPSETSGFFSSIRHRITLMTMDPTSHGMSIYVWRCRWWTD